MIAIAAEGHDLDAPVGFSARPLDKGRDKRRASAKKIMARVVLITGVTGQEGAYLAEFLLARGYHVHWIQPRTSLFNTDRIDHLFHESHEAGLPFTLHHGDMTDSSSLVRTIAETKPDEIFNLAAQSHVAVCGCGPCRQTAGTSPRSV